MAQHRRPLDDRQTRDESSTTAQHGSAAGAHETPADNLTTSRTGVAGPIKKPRLERISIRAYELFEQRGGEGGRAIEDWLQAEREIDRDE